jgi:hypothetical protein
VGLAFLPKRCCNNIAAMRRFPQLLGVIAASTLSAGPRSLEPNDLGRCEVSKFQGKLGGVLQLTVLQLICKNPLCDQQVFGDA